MSLKLGTDKITDKDFKISADKRYQNSTVYGSIGSGKTRSMLLSMAVEQFSDINSGATFITSQGDESWLLDRMANKMGREVIFLHPDSDKGTDDFLETEYHTSYEMQKNLIDYIDAIQKKKIVIVDFDLSRNRKNGKNALIKLMYQLQRSLVYNNEEHPHHVYIDDAEFILPYIEELLKYGKDKSVGTTLFLSSYTLIEAKSRELAYFLDANTATTIVMSKLAYADYVYFDKRFYGDMNNKKFKSRKKDEVVVETIIDDVIEIRDVIIKVPSASLMTELEDEVKREKKSRIERRRPRKRGVLQEKVQSDMNVKDGFEEAISPKRIFLDEDDFFSSL